MLENKKKKIQKIDNKKDDKSKKSIRNTEKNCVHDFFFAQLSHANKEILKQHFFDLFRTYRRHY